MDGSKSCFKDCLQQLKILVDGFGCVDGWEGVKVGLRDAYSYQNVWWIGGWMVRCNGGF